MARRAFHDVPAVVDAGGRHWSDIDFLESASAYIRDIEQPGHAIEREPPRISQPDRPDFPPATAIRVRIGRRDGIGIATIHVDAKELGEQHVAILAIAVRISLAPTITRADVQHSIRAKEISPPW